MKSLVFAIAVTLAVLYVPGFLLLRSIRFSRLLAVACAPLAAFFLYAVLSIAYWPLGIECNSVSVGLLSFAICLGCFVAQRTLRKGPVEHLDLAHRSMVHISARDVPFEWVALALYVAIGLFACWFMFVSQLPGGGAFFGQWDNQLHLNVVRSFLDTGQWSSLHVSAYAASPEYAIPDASHVERYPAAWHDVVALVCTISGRSITVCVNALNVVLAGVVYPGAMFLLVKTLFAKDRLTVVAGAGIASAFTAFPWGMFVKGPLYPNFASFTLMVLVMAVIVTFFERKLVCAMRIPFAVFSVVAIVAVALSHPNALFALLVFFAAYASHGVWTRIRSSNRWSQRKRTLIAVVSSGSVIVAAVLALFICSAAPLMQSVVQHNMIPTLSIPDAIGATVLLDLGKAVPTSSAPEYLLAVPAACGFAYCIIKRKFWLLVPPVYMALALILARSADTQLTRLLAGLWYNDPVRLASCYELFIAPIAAYGAAGITRIPSWIRARASRGSRSHFEDASMAHVLVVAAITIALFVPMLPLPDDGMIMFGMGKQLQVIRRSYAKGIKTVYSKHERQFVKEAQRIIPEGSLVLNQPHDGSAFSYALEGMNTYYRKASFRAETPESKIIRKSLVDFASDSTVYDAVKSIGADYLILLDYGVAKPDGKWMVNYLEASWAGINAVRDGTPGFTLLLARDDMRLYRIDYR